MPTENQVVPGEPRVSVPTDPFGPPTAINASSFVQTALQAGIEQNHLGDLGVPVMVTIMILQLVSDPAAVKLYVTQAVRSITLEFDVLDRDKGKVIGKGGHTIDAIRSLARSMAGSSEREYQISLIEARPASQDTRPAYRNY